MDLAADMLIPLRLTPEEIIQLFEKGVRDFLDALLRQSEQRVIGCSPLSYALILPSTKFLKLILGQQCPRLALDCACSGSCEARLSSAK